MEKNSFECKILIKLSFFCEGYEKNKRYYRRAIIGGQDDHRNPG